MKPGYATFTFEPSEHALDDDERRNFRNSLGHYPTGVAVVTALAADTTRVGLTVNSFISVSLHPPLILWSVGNNARSAAHFKKGVRFAVNLLAHEQKAVAQQFARSAPDKFRGVECETGQDGVPLIRGCLGWIEARVQELYPCGDHLLIIGHVDRFAHLEDGDPLIYHRGRYKHFAES